jgi:hypothetical protein
VNGSSREITFKNKVIPLKNVEKEVCKMRIENAGKKEYNEYMER